LVLECREEFGAAWPSLPGRDSMDASTLGQSVEHLWGLKFSPVRLGRLYLVCRKA